MARSFVGRILDRSPVPYVSRAQSGRRAITKTADRERQLNAMGSVGTLFGIVDLLAESVSQVDWKLYRKNTDARRHYATEHADTRREVTQHAALNVWNKPNPFMTRQEFVEIYQQHHDLTGEGWWLPLANPDFPSAGPLEMWPVRPDRMEPIPDRENYLSGYVYRGPEGELVPLDLNQVIFLRRPNPVDPYRGMGPVQALLATIDSVRYSAEWNRNFFLNSAEPGGIIEVPEGLSDPDFNKLRDRWNEQHRGVANAHRVAILEHGKWVDRKFTMRDMQFAELQTLSREVLREAYRIHAHMLGISQDVNRANAEAADATFARRLIVPRLERIKGALNNDFLPLFGVTGQGVEFDYCNPVPEDRELESKLITAQANAAAALRDAGWDPDDVLVAVGLPEMRYGGARREDLPVGA